MDDLGTPRHSPTRVGRRNAAARRPWAVMAAVAWMLQGCGGGREADLNGLRADEIDYNWQVRPILSENCFRCHGPDPSSV